MMYFLIPIGAFLVATRLAAMIRCVREPNTDAAQAQEDEMDRLYHENNAGGF